jgi:uncharacterized membrane protein (DUF106 family)
MTITDLIQANPKVGIIVLAFIVTLFITIVTYFMTDKEKMKGIKDKQKALRIELKQHKDNPQKVMEINKKMMEDIPEQLKHSFKPMIITIVPIIFFFNWIRSALEETTLASTWLWWYIGASLIFSIILRKIFKMQ